MRRFFYVKKVEETEKLRLNRFKRFQRFNTLNNKQQTISQSVNYHTAKKGGK